MDEAPEIRNLGDGKYSFLVGRAEIHSYHPSRRGALRHCSLTIRDLVASFPRHFRRRKAPSCAYVFSHELDDIKCRIESICELS